MIRPTSVGAPRSDHFTPILIALSAIGIGTVLAREINCGVGLEWDSANYIVVARNLLAGEGFVQIFAHKPYTLWPPLYPLLLAGASFFVFDPRDVAGPVNAILFAATIFVAGQWLRQNLKSRLLVLWGCLAMALAFPLAHLAARAMSETPFIFLATLALVRIGDFLRDGARSSLLWAAAFSALTCLTRYMGIAVLGAIVSLLIFQRGVPPLDKAKRIVAYALISATPLGLWLLRNFLLIGSLTGNRRGDLDFLEILNQILTLVEKWAFLPPALVGIALLALAIAVGYICFFSLRKTDVWTDWQPFFTFGGFALAYLILLVVATLSGYAWFGIHNRFLVPLYIPILFAALFAIDRILRMPRIEVWGKNFLEGAVFIALSPWLLYSGIANVQMIARANEGSSMGYANTQWLESEVLHYIRGADGDAAIVTNRVAATYLHTKARANHYAMPCDADGLQRLLTEKAAGADDVYAVWFYDATGWCHGAYGLPEVRALPRLVQVATLSDGVIFRVARRRSEVETRRK